MRSFSRAAAAAAMLLLMAGCGRGRFDDIGISAVELRQAPKLEFLRARVGMRFLEVRFEIENRAKEPLVLIALDFALRDSAGKLYPYSAQVLDMGQPRGEVKVQVPPGARLAGSIVFQIPDSAQPAELIYRQSEAGGLATKLSP